MKKNLLAVVLMVYIPVHAVTSVMNHRMISSSPLLYKQNDYAFSSNNMSLEFESFVTESFDPDHIVSNLMPYGSMPLSFSQQGLGNINPAWLYLGSQNGYYNYTSTVSFDPSQQLYGLLFHCYEQYKHFFFDMRTALLQAKAQVKINEFGDHNGGIDNKRGEIVRDAYQAFTQNAFHYGKIGDEQKVIGFDDIQVMIGATGQVSTKSDARTSLFLAGFALLEVPTGSGTQAIWLFEPQVGSNHWAFGFGFDSMLQGRHGYTFVCGGNFRHFIANWETRSFDLEQNGAWSRYLLVDELSTVGTGLLYIGQPGINIFSQQALIEGRNQINFYGRLKKDFGGGYLELSYDLFYQQAEKIAQITRIPSGYGIHNISNVGGLNTASTAKISEAYPTADLYPVELVTSDLNLASGAAGQWLSNTVAVRLQRVCDMYTYGFGASIDLARTAQAISSWAVWFNFEYLFDYTHHGLSSQD